MNSIGLIIKFIGYLFKDTEYDKENHNTNYKENFNNNIKQINKYSYYDNFKK
jgi:hypothetical protein